MNEHLQKYLSGILISITVVIVTTGFSLGSKVLQQGEKIEDLEKKVMTSDLINEKFKNVDQKLSSMEKTAEKRDEKLDRILEKLK